MITINLPRFLNISSCQPLPKMPLQTIQNLLQLDVHFPGYSLKASIWYYLHGYHRVDGSNLNGSCCYLCTITLQGSMVPILFL
jgi:hypothetical protein